MDELVESFSRELQRIMHQHALSPIKVVVLEDLPAIEITLAEGGRKTIGPLKKGAETMMPVWLTRVLSKRGLVVLHRDENIDDHVMQEGSNKLGPLPEFFYPRARDWLDTMQKLVAMGMVAENIAKRTKSDFISFLTRRFKILLEAMTLQPQSFMKNLSKEEAALARQIQALIEEWENVVLKDNPSFPP